MNSLMPPPVPRPSVDSGRSGQLSAGKTLSSRKNERKTLYFGPGKEGQLYCFSQLKNTPSSLDISTHIGLLFAQNECGTFSVLHLEAGTCKLSSFSPGFIQIYGQRRRRSTV